MSATRNSATLNSFVAYAEAHPGLRFWQALRAWADVGYIWTSERAPWDGDFIPYDTFYWEGRTHDTVPSPNNP